MRIVVAVAIVLALATSVSAQTVRIYQIDVEQADAELGEHMPVWRRMRCAEVTR